MASQVPLLSAFTAFSSNRPDQATVPDVPPDYADWYWTKVKECYSTILKQADESDVDRARERLKTLDGNQPNVMIYNLSPLDAAVDIAKRDPGSISRKERDCFERLIRRNKTRSR